MSDTDLKNILARLQRLEDLEAIRYTWNDYLRGVDSEDWDRYGDTFTEDAVLEVVGLDVLLPGSDQVFRGRRDIIDNHAVPAAGAVVNPSANLFGTGHIGSNMQIDIEGDKAITQAYWSQIVANNMILIGSYQHRVRREPDRWRFEFLRISVRYYAQLAAENVGGQSLREVLENPIPTEKG